MTVLRNASRPSPAKTRNSAPASARRAIPSQLWHRRSLSALLTLCSACAYATEGGGNSYPMGVETNYNGVMLSDGAHWFAYYAHYSATHSRNAAGVDNPQLARFRIESDVIAPRLSYVWPGLTLLGARVETRVVQAIASVDLDAAVARRGMPSLERGGYRLGLADMAFTPIILGWNWSTYHHTIGIDTHLKTGSYDVRERVNTGRNYAQAAVFYAFTWFPAPGFDINAKFRYAINGKNKATNYQSGDEATIEFSGGYRINPGLAIGLNGYVYRQTSDDGQNGVAVNNGNRGRVNALGPYISYNLTPRLALVAKVQSEFSARNRPQGTRVWLQARIPF